MQAAEPPPKQFAEAQNLFEKGRWKEAENAFIQSASSGILKYESLFMVALCKEKRKLFKQAEADYSRLIRDELAYRQSSDSVAKCYLHLHGILCNRKNITSQRSVLLSECERRFPRHAIIGEMYANEAAEWLKSGNVEKTKQYYAKGKHLLPEQDAIVADLLAPGKMVPVSDTEMEKLTTLVRTAKGFSLGPLCTAIALRPGGWQAECLYADTLAKNGKANEADARYEALLQRRIGPEAEIRLARAETIAFRSTHPKDALPLFEKWLQAYPKHRMREKALYQYALLLGKNGRPDMAVQSFDAFLKEFPTGSYTMQARKQQEKFRAVATAAAKREASVKEREQAFREDPLLSALEKAEKAHRSKVYDFAIREYLRFRGYERHPQWGRAWYGLGVCYRETGRTDAAIEVWNAVWSRSLLATGTLAAVESRIAEGNALLSDKGNARQALSCYADALTKQPELQDNDGFELNRAIALLVGGRKDEAVQIFVRKRDSCPEKSYAYFYWDKMIRFCNTQPPHQLIPGKGTSDRLALSRLYLGDSYFASGQYHDAERQYHLAAKQISNSEQAAFCLLQTARCMAYQKKTNEALHLYATILRKYPDSSYADDALFLAGNVWAGSKNNVKKAESCFMRIVRDYPNSNRAEASHYYVTMLLYQIGEYEKALYLIKDFLCRHPNSRIHSYLTENLLPELQEKCKPEKGK